MEMHNVPEDVIHQIALSVHKECYSDILNDINTVHMFNNLYKKPFSEVEYYIDDWVDWKTVIVKLENNAFGLYHVFHDGYYEELIAEGTLHENMYTFHRFAYIRYNKNKAIITDVDTCLDRHMTGAPLDYLTRTLHPHLQDFTYTQSKNCKSCEQWDSIKNWYRGLIRYNNPL
jgi:hypothetical protein